MSNQGPPPPSRWGAPLPNNDARPRPASIGGGSTTAPFPPSAGSARGAAADPNRRGRGYDTFREPSHNFDRDQQRDRGGRGEGYRPRGGSMGDGGRDRDRDRDRGGRWDRRDGWEDDRDRHYHERGGRNYPSRERDFDSDWKCMECGVHNDPRDERCARCREWRSSKSDRSRGDDDRRRDDYYGPPSHHDDRSRPRDDFEGGRHASRKKARKSTDNRDEDQGPIQREWPPSFESSGASFIFDARSGMFYEPASDFFYDPKTKLYYSNKKQKYFQYVVDAKPPFQPFGEQQTSVQGGPTGLNQGAGAVTGAEEATVVSTVVGDFETTMVGKTSDPSKAVEKAEPKSKIAICLKSLPNKDTASKSLSEVATTEKNKLMEKKISARKDASTLTPTTSAGAKPQSHKKHEKDMDMWSERVKEMRGDESTTASPDKDKQVGTVEPRTKIVKTASGQPICVLCKRKFSTIEKLQQHEKLSALHKENLAKKAAVEADAKTKATDSNKETPKEAYRDRSKERRLLYGDMSPYATSITPSHTDTILAQSQKPKSMEEVRPEETLGASNVGNKLLQKLGWKSGDALGRKQDENGAQSSASSTGDATSNLKNDWERIEALTRGGGRSR